MKPHDPDQGSCTEPARYTWYAEPSGTWAGPGSASTTHSTRCWSSAHAACDAHERLTLSTGTGDIPDPAMLESVGRAVWSDTECSMCPGPTLYTASSACSAGSCSRAACTSPAPEFELPVACRLALQVMPKAQGASTRCVLHTAPCWTRPADWLWHSLI